MNPVPSSGDALFDMVKILVDAGATHASAARAAVTLERGGSYDDAWEHIQIALQPAVFDAQLLTAEISRARELVHAGARA